MQLLIPCNRCSISDDPVLIDSDESIQLQRKVRTHECSANCLQQFSDNEVLVAVWGICKLSVEDPGIFQCIYLHSG